MERTIERTPEEVAEIERHKYFLSEKMGHDVGWETAEQDWEANYAADFRAAQDIHRPQLHHEPHVVPVVPRGGLKMLFHRMFSRNNDVDG